MTRILIVEDEAASAELLKQLLDVKGYKTQWVTSAEAALQKIKAAPPELAIIDVGLPGASGFNLCAELKKHPQTLKLPIIMLTSRKEEHAKVEGLLTGADDYVTKPYSAKELIARIEALMRRVNNRGAVTDRILKAGKITVNLDTHEAKVGTKIIDLGPKEFELLALFLQRKGRVLFFSFIAESVWGDDRIASRQDIRFWVHRLREKLGPAGDAIQTITGQGYKLDENR